MLITIIHHICSKMQKNKIFCVFFIDTYLKRHIFKDMIYCIKNHYTNYSFLEVQNEILSKLPYDI